MRRVQLEKPVARPWWGGRREAALPEKGYAPIDRMKAECDRLQGDRA
jgi:hypothetical protein